jgi:hypothetical protein
MVWWFAWAAFVMAGLVPAIHVFADFDSKDVDARHKAGHDENNDARRRLAVAMLAVSSS